MTEANKSLYAAVLLIFLSGFCAIRAVDRHSLTYDAVKYPASGYDYLRTLRLRTDPENPPVGKVLTALPFLIIDADPPQLTDGSDERGFDTGWRFFFRNKVPGDVLAYYARLPAVAAGMLLALTLFLFARRRFSGWGSLVALVFLLAGPMYRALTTLATTDIFLALFFLSAVYWLDRELEGERPNQHYLSGAGIFAAAAVLTKFSGLLFYPLAAAAVLRRRRLMLGILDLIVLGMPLLILSTMLYGSDFGRLWEGVLFQKTVLSRGPHLTFFWDVLEKRAWPQYYLVSFFLKTPYPFLLALAAGLFFWVRTPERRQIVLVAAPFLLFLAAASGNRFYATRYLFPVYPLLALTAAAAWDFGRRRGKVLILILAAWQVGEAAWAYPHYLSYMNLPWRAQGHRYLANSDFDWGQDLPALADFLTLERRPPLQLCYFGTSDPEAWGIEAQQLATVSKSYVSDTVLPLAPERELLAVSAGCRQYMTVRAGAETLRAWAWLDKRRPIKVVAGTFFIYDIRDDAEAHGRIGQLHAAQGDLRKALREAQRVLEIEPGSAEGKAFLSFVRGRMGGEAGLIQ
ncbi:MAG: glycosyltransferase family 39 protein [Elusimicrobiota bacterium]